MTFPLEGPCGLVAAGSCCPGWASADQADKDRASAMAAIFLWANSSRMYGACEVVVRPCGTDCNDYSTYWGPSEASTSFFPELQANGTYVNCMGGTCGCNPCNCCHVCGVDLEFPVASITQVKVDGVVVDPATYFVADRRKLISRTGCFPKCQNLALPSNAVGTFEVTYVYGLPLGEAGQAALDALACEFLKLCQGQSCKLPSRWRSISREGITMDAYDDLATLDNGRIGILEVDTWLSAVNPNRAQMMPYIPKMTVAGSSLMEQTWP